VGKQCTFNTIVVMSSFCHIFYIHISQDHNRDIQIDQLVHRACTTTISNPWRVYHIFSRWLIALFLTYDNDTIYICNIYSHNVCISTVAGQQWGHKTPTIFFMLSKHTEIIWTRKCTFKLKFGFQNVLCLNFVLYLFYLHKHGSVLAIYVSTITV